MPASFTPLLMAIYDVSVALADDTPIYPGDPKIEISQFFSLDSGDPANVSLIRFGAHSGTHVDAPAHFIPGAPRVDSLSLETLIGPAQVIDVPDKIDIIDGEFIDEHCAAASTRVLFKTRNSSFWNNNQAGFRSDYTALDAGGARKLVELGVELIGIDYLSVEKFGSPSFETHHTLLSHGMVIIEGLDLRQISAGTYELICLPLRIAAGAGDGAPARVVLRTLENS